MSDAALIPATWSRHESLYGLLPSIYRERDVPDRGPLRTLLSILETELEVVRDDIEDLYDNWFIETCAEWVVPYIGDLLGVRSIIEVPGSGFTHRAFVANVLSYRRGKGTAATLERVARDLTGYPARAVEYFRLLGTTQHLNHVRPGAGGTANLRDGSRMELTGGPFDPSAHTAEVRHIDAGRGRYNIMNIGLFLWRLQAYALTGVPAPELAAAQPAAAGRFTFSPLGLDAPLFNQPRPEGDIASLAGEANVPGPVRRRSLNEEVEGLRRASVEGRTPRPVYLAEPPALRLVVDGAEVPPEQISVCDLSDPPTPIPEVWRRPAATRTYRDPAGVDVTRPIQVGVDPALGRIAFPAGVTPATVVVDYTYGAPGDLGGGPYDRRGSVQTALTGPDGLPRAVDWQIGVAQGAPANHPHLVSSLAAAVGRWNALPAAASRVGVIAVTDSGTYPESLTGADSLVMPAGSLLLVVAAGWPEEPGPPAGRRRAGRLAPAGVRPHVRGSISVRGTAPAGAVDPGRLVVDGLLVEGGLTVLVGNLGAVRLAHSTLVPGAGGLTVNPSVNAGQRNERLEVELERCVIDAVSLPDTTAALSIADSLVGPGPGPGPGAAVTATDARIAGSTVLGTVQLRTLEATNSIFMRDVTVERRQVGCVRFSYLTLASRAPRRYRCQPVDATAASHVEPQFTRLRFGDPAYGQLAPWCPPEILTGADDEGELGAFNFVKHAQRLENLATNLEDYLRVGLEAGVLRTDQKEVGT